MSKQTVEIGIGTLSVLLVTALTAFAFGLAGWFFGVQSFTDGPVQILFSMGLAGVAVGLANLRSAVFHKRNENNAEKG